MEDCHVELLEKNKLIFYCFLSGKKYQYNPEPTTTPIQYLAEIRHLLL
jgi:hypothetical protein